MGKAYYCDRCGELNDHFEFPSFEVEIKIDENDFADYTLCMGCKGKIESWFLGDDLKKGEKSE